MALLLVKVLLVRQVILLPESIHSVKVIVTIHTQQYVLIGVLQNVEQTPGLPAAAAVQPRGFEMRELQRLRLLRRVALRTRAA